ncbi:MAG TPA: hypothetical protein VNE40_00330 [Candidatus Dormibacteraeota bacterium]|nr:hypothetical protein [Candidatus Dormibacteraeota bacterium]
MAEVSGQAQTEVPSFYPYADGFSVGDNTLAYITRMRQPVEVGEVPSGELLVGDILRRTCKLGGTACAGSGCQAPEGYSNIDRLCSDLNIKDVTERLGIEAKDLLMVGVTADGAGFYDKLDSYGESVKTNSVGIRELPGYNAFFAKASEGVVLGARLADCGFAAIEFKDDQGEDVLGFVHMTRPNLQGESKLGFEVNGQPAGSFEYFMHEALAHYGGDIATAKVHLVAAIKAENFQHTFKDEDGQRPEDKFPGWIDQGLLVNRSDSKWTQGDSINSTDVWEPQYREMLRWQITRSGITSEQLSEEDMIDPADLELGHASNHAGAHGKMPDARDAYLVMPRTYQAA